MIEIKDNKECRKSIILQTSDEFCGHSMTYLKGIDCNNENYYIVVDCGIAMQKEDDDKEAKKRVNMINRNLPIKDDEIGKIKAVLITHDHDDHIGLIPYLVKRGYKGPIYLSDFSRVEIGPLLQDCCYICNLEGAMLYDKSDVRKSISLIKTIRPNEEFEIFSDNSVRVSVVPLKNNHLPGAYSYFIMYRFSNGESFNIMATGDIKYNNEFLIDYNYPDWIKNLPVTIMCESTYGGSFSNEIKSDGFEENVAKIFNRGGNVIIATIANERLEILLHKLYVMKQTMQIPTRTKIFVKGTLAQELFYLIRAYRDTIGVPNDYIFDYYDIEFMNNKKMTPKNKHYIMLVTPGMMKAGNSLAMAIKEASNPLSGLILTSYVPPNGVAKRFIDTPKGETISLPDGKTIVKNFDVYQYTKISGHSKANELKELLLDQFSDKKAVIINHGDPENQEKFKKYLENEYMGHVPTFVASRKVCFRITSNGVEEVLNSDLDDYSNDDLKEESNELKENRADMYDKSEDYLEYDEDELYKKFED